MPTTNKNIPFPYFLLLGILFSCSKPSEKVAWGYLEDVNFIVDTLMVDAGEEIIFLKYGLQTADVGVDGKYLLNFNMDDHTLEKINLDRLVLEEKIPFDKEGPNGTGEGFGGFKIIEENQFAIEDIRGISLFSFDGEKLANIHYDAFFLEKNLLESGEFIRSTSLDKKAKRLYAMINRWDTKITELGVFHVDTYDVLRISLPDFHDLSKYAITLWIGKSSIGMGPSVALKGFDNVVVLSNPTTSSMAIYDTAKDSLHVKNFESRLTANQKILTYQLEHETEESLDAELARFYQEIHFLAPFWDEQNQVFYRFSYMDLPSGSEIRSGVQSRIFLSVLDKDLNLIGEAEVPGLDKKPTKSFSGQFPKHFAKGGKIWIYENIHDELGFVVLTMVK